MKTIEFLDAVKERHNLTSDYQLAKFLKIRQSGISHYRTGKGGFDDEVAIKIAGVLDMPAGYVLACAHAEREAKRPKVRDAWEKLARTMVATFFGMAVFSQAIIEAETAGEAAEHAERASIVYYVKCLIAHFRGLMRPSYPLTVSAGGVA